MVARRGTCRWSSPRLERRAPRHFPSPTLRVAGDLNLSTTLIAQINAMRDDASIQDATLALEAKQPKQEPVVEIIDINGELVTPQPDA
jgi:hypothetical protein